MITTTPLMQEMDTFEPRDSSFRDSKMRDLTPVDDRFVPITLLG